MTSPMTPAGMREVAERLRWDAENYADDGQARDAIAGADALDRLAGVIEYAEVETRREGARWAGRRTFARDVLNRVRDDFHIFGETNEGESNA